jgi:hypothetical protein
MNAKQKLARNYIRKAVPVAAVVELTTEQKLERANERLEEYAKWSREALEDAVARAQKQATELASKILAPSETPSYAHLEYALRWGDGLAQVLQSARLSAEVLFMLDAEQVAAHEYPVMYALGEQVKECTRRLVNAYELPTSTSMGANMESVAKTRAMSEFVQRHGGIVREFEKQVAERDVLAASVARDVFNP